MVWAVVLAVIALVIAIGFGAGALLRNSELRLRQHHLEDALTSVRDQVDVANRQLAMALEQLSVSRENYDAALKSAQEQQLERLSGLRRQANAHFLTADSDAGYAARLVTELEQYTIRTLEHEASKGSRPVILRGGLYAAQPSVLDVVPELIDRFLAAIGADLMYRQDDGPDGSKFYLRWPTGVAEPRLVLGSLLRMAASEGGSGKDDPGAAELRTLMHAMRDGGLAVAYFGPLVVANTAENFWAGLAPADWRGLDEDQKTTAVKGVGPSLLTQIGSEVIAEISRSRDEQAV